MGFVPGTFLSLSECVFLRQSNYVLEQHFNLSSDSLVSVGSSSFESCYRCHLFFFCYETTSMLTLNSGLQGLKWPLKKLNIYCCFY